MEISTSQNKAVIIFIVTTMYNLVSCYEMKVRGDVLSDKVYLNDTDMNMDMEGLKLSQSESILTDMTHVLSPMYDHCNNMGGKSPIQSIGKFRQIKRDHFYCFPFRFSRSWWCHEMQRH